jgi:hypothetical protein
MKAVSIILAATLLQQTGCDQPAPKPAAAPAAQDQTHYQRFIPIPRETFIVGAPLSWSVALDTMTGRLCRTYDMQMKGWESVPLCYQLYLADRPADPAVQKILDDLKKLGPPH